MKKFREQLVGKIWSNPLFCHFLPVTKEMTAERKRIGPIFARRLAGKIWSNPLCCYFLHASKEMTKKRIGPNLSRTFAGKIWTYPLCCDFLPEPSREDWTKFCQTTRGQNLNQSSLLSLPTGNQGNDGREDRTKFCQTPRGQNLVQSSLLSLPTGNQAERIGPQFARQINMTNTTQL